MSIFFDEDNAKVAPSNESWSLGAKTDFMENASAAFKAFRKTELSTSEYINEGEEIGNAIQILNEAGHSDILDPLDPMNFTVDDTEIAPNRDAMQADFWKKVEELAELDPILKNKLTEAGLQSQAAMHETIKKKSHSAWQEFTDINQRATGYGKAGGFAGIAGGAFTDPFMQMGVVASFGYSIPTTIGAAALRISLMEAAIGGVAETAIQLKAQPYRKELGFEDAGLATGAKNIATVAVASGVLSPLLFGVFKAFGRGIDVGKKHLLKLPTEDLQKINKELGEINPKFKNETLENAEIPKKDIPETNTPAARTEHRERLDTAIKAINDDAPVDLPPIKNKIIYHGTNKYFKEFDLNKTADQSIWFTDDINAIKAGTVGATGKGNIIERILDEKKLKLATAEQADKLTDDQLISQGFDGVKFERSAGFTENNYRIFNTEKLDVTSPVSSKSGFNKTESKLAEDIEAVKDFDVPTEATFKNQALNNERSVFDVSTSSSIRSEAGAGAAAKTSPTEFSEATQALSAASQRTDATPVSVLAKANTEPPLFRGLDTSNVGVKSAIVGSKSPISNKVYYHKTDNFDVIYNTLAKKMPDVKSNLEPIAIKYGGDLKARIKAKKELKKKLKNGIKPEHISDYLGTRISTETIFQAQMALNDLSKQFKILSVDDFLSDAGRVAESGTEYRAIHAQALTDDGFSFEIQIRIKDLDPLTEQSHAIYKQKKFPEKEYTDAEFAKIVKEEKTINAKLKAKYFEIKDKEFLKLKSTDPMDIPIPVGTRLDDATGEKIPLTKTARELFEEDAKNATMLKRLENCV